MTIPESNMVPNPAPMLKKDSTLAIISLVSGLAGWLIPLVGGIVAIVTGHLARKEIRESHNTLGGEGMALAGLILGYIHVGIVILFFILLIVLIPTTIRSFGY